MSRFDGEITAASEVSLQLEELLAAFGSAAAAGCNRTDAMAQFLSGAEGWQGAKAALRGTFAGMGSASTGLTNGQD